MRHVDLLSPDLGDALWPTFARYRREEPVVWVPSAQMFCVFRHADIKACLTGAEYTVDYPFRVSRQVFGTTLLDLDGPDHARLRRCLGGLLVGRDDSVPFAGSVADCVAAVLDELAAAGEFDFVSAVARALPERVTGAFLGIPADDRGWLFSHLRHLLGHLDGSGGGFAATAGLRDDVRALVERLLLAGTSDSGVISRLGAMTRAGELDLDEAIGLVMLVLAAGVETSTGLLANTMVALERFPQWREPGDDEGLTRVVREAARWQPPQMDTVRFARVDTSLGGVPIAAGQALKLLLGSGNRDEAVFTDPECFRPDRTERAGLSFGYGAHSCLGMHLATGVAVRFFAAFLRRFPKAETIGEVPSIGGWTFRGPEAMAMTVGGDSP